MDKDLSVYLTSLKVFKKCSDITVKELLGKLENPKNRKSDIKSASLLKDSKSISRVDMDINFPDLLKKSMIINNKVAVKGLAFPEQKIITTSNYSQAVIADTLKQVKIGVIVMKKRLILILNISLLIFILFIFSFVNVNIKNTTNDNIMLTIISNFKNLLDKSNV